ncbi:hypothetical protein PHMEG_0007118, partial [Phytophthora megakarya]
MAPRAHLTTSQSSLHSPLKYDVSSNVSFMFNAVMSVCATKKGALEWAQKVSLVDPANAAEHENNVLICQVYSPSVQADKAAAFLGVPVPRDYERLRSKLKFPQPLLDSGHWHSGDEEDTAKGIIAGTGHAVEIDETSLKKKQKYRRGNRHPHFWVFGEVDRNTI